MSNEIDGTPRPVSTADMDARIARAAPVFDAALGGFAIGLAAAGIVFTGMDRIVMGVLCFSLVLIVGVAKLRSAAKKLTALGR
jgi:hypothetical protein